MVDDKTDDMELRTLDAGERKTFGSMKEELIALLELGHVLPENFLAFFASHHNLGRLAQLVVLLFFVALGTVVPFLAAGGANLHLGVENVLAHLNLNN